MQCAGVDPSRFKQVLSKTHIGQKFNYILVGKAAGRLTAAVLPDVVRS